MNTFRNLDLRRLGVDEAYINISSTLSDPIWMYSLSEECYKCPYSRVQKISPRRDNVIKVSTKFNVNWKFFDQDVGPYTLEASREAQAVCEIRQPDLGEFGVYDVHILGTGNCAINTALQPVNIYLRKCEFYINK